MDKINIEDIILKGKRYFVRKDTKHPFVYSDGCVDLSALGDKRLIQLMKEHNKNIVSEVFKYLQSPQEYVKKDSVLNPQYLVS